MVPHHRGSVRFYFSSDSRDPFTSHRDVAQTRTFWLMAAGLVCATVPCYTSNKHLILYLRDLGLSATDAAWIKSYFVAVSGLGRLLVGFS